MFRIAASDGVLLAEVMQELTEQIKALGPSEANLKMVIYINSDSFIGFQVPKNRPRRPLSGLSD